MRRGLIAGAIALSCVLVALPPASAAAGRLVYADAFGGSALRVISAAGGHSVLLPGTLGRLRWGNSTWRSLASAFTQATAPWRPTKTAPDPSGAQRGRSPPSVPGSRTE